MSSQRWHVLVYNQVIHEARIEMLEFKNRCDGVMEHGCMSYIAMLC